MSSNAHRTSRIVFDDIMFERRAYDPWLAATSVLLAASPLVDGVTGWYFEDCNEALPTTDPDAENGVRPHALDPSDAARLWDVAIELLKLDPR